MFFWLKFLNRTESSSFDYLFQTGERSLRVGLMTLTSRFTRHKRMNEKNLKFSSLSFSFWVPKVLSVWNESSQRERVCVCVPKGTRDQHDRYVPRCVLLFPYSSRGNYTGKKDRKKKKRKKKLTEKNRIGFRRIERKGRPCMEKVSLSLFEHFWAPSFFLSRPLHSTSRHCTDEYLTHSRIIGKTHISAQNNPKELAIDTIQKGDSRRETKIEQTTTRHGIFFFLFFSFRLSRSVIVWRVSSTGKFTRREMCVCVLRRESICPSN
jgi:hypothetical protein